MRKPGDLHLPRRKFQQSAEGATFQRHGHGTGNKNYRQADVLHRPCNGKVVRQCSPPPLTHTGPFKNLTPNGGRAAPAKIRCGVWAQGRRYRGVPGGTFRLQVGRFDMNQRPVAAPMPGSASGATNCPNHVADSDVRVDETNTSDRPSA